MYYQNHHHHPNTRAHKKTIASFLCKRGGGETIIQVMAIFKNYRRFSCNK